MSRFLQLRSFAPFLVAILLSACGGETPGPATTPATPAALSVAVSPGNGATGVALDVVLTVTANTTLDGNTVNSTSVTLVEVGAGPVVGAINVVGGNTVTFQPLIALNANTQYIATVTTAVRNTDGSSLASNQSLSFTTVTTPGAPVIGSAAVASATSATVSFSPPASNGGAAITSYTVTSVPSNITATGAASPLTVTGLSTGTPYTFTVTATNSVGVGPPSAPSNSVTPVAGASVPGAPTAVVATAGDSQASVAFLAPASLGVPASISNYTVTALVGGVPTAISASGGASPIVVPGLTNGTAYTFVVTAFNTTGAGPASAPSAAVTPAGVPGAPTSASATATSGQATISFVAPVNTGGSPITAYTATSNPGGFTATGAATSLTVTGLTDGTPYTFTVTATNAVGTGPASLPTNSVTPTVGATAPGAPTTVTAVAGNAQATVSFAAPGITGGSPILSYTVTALIGGVPTAITASGGGTSIVVPGLTNGTAYTFRVTATNAIGTGPASAPSSAVTPATVPGAPAAAAATAGNAQATVSFTAPASNGGSAITGYTVTSNPAGGVDSNAGTPGLSHVITGLTNGIAYTFTVTATNAVGTGTPSAASNSVTPTAATVSGAPTAVTATPGNTQATVTFVAPASNGGSAITGYTVTSSPPGGVDTNAGTTGLSHVITGLTNGVAYTFTVTATNAVGLSPASAPSNAVVPATLPGAPLTVSAVAGDSQATVSFSPPASNGGSAITGYRVTSNPGGITAFGGASGTPITVTGLTNTVNYAFTVAAINAIGTGPESAFSNNVTPNVATTAPTQPLTVTAVRGNGQATVTFAAPASNGGCGPAPTYLVTSNPAGGTDLAANTGGLTHTVNGLTNGVAYTFTVTATNCAGVSAPSAASNSVTPADVPGAPTAVSAIAGNTQATVSFAAAPNNGDPVTLYTVFVCSPGCVAGPTTASVTPVVVTGLSNGTTYTFTVRAANTVGNGPQSAASNAVIPNPTATVPGAPTGAAATAGNTQATVTFAAPASDGGSMITGYTVTSSPPGGVDSNAGTTGLSHVITGLTNGVAYTFTVRATNAIGTGPASGASNTVTPATVPSAPAAPTVIAGNAQATVSFVPPANGGAAIINYTVSALIAGVPTGITAIGAASPIVVTGLTNNQAYTFTVAATNSIGTGADSPQSAMATPSSATVPSAPTAATATAGNGQASVAFTPGADNGSPITSFTVTSTPGGFTGTGATSPIVVTGLANGTAYTFRVTATNGIGVSPQSAASNSVTPVGAPGAPTGVSASAGNTQATVSFTPPASNGGSPITSYTVTSSPSNIVATGAGTTITYPPGSLVNGTPYTFTVTATNAAAFTSAPSAASNSVIPTASATACSNTTPVVSAGTGRISLRAQANRVTGVAPLGVLFDATATTSTATTRPYHDIQYSWDFDDAGSGVWTTGARAGTSSRNAATGPLAAHYYNPTPGTYTAGTLTKNVTLTATDGVESATCSIQIVITDPEVQFAANTLCVSASGNFTGCPAGATTLVSNNFASAVSGNAAVRKRILFRSGETFTSLSNANLNANGPGHVGIFPIGAVARAVVTGATTKVVLGTSGNLGFSDWRITDIDFDGVNRTGGQAGIFPASAATQITLWNNIFRNLDLGINMSLFMLDSINSSSQLAPIWNQWLIGQNQFITNHQYAYLGTMNRSAAMGNSVTLQESQHAWRLEHGQKNVISNNDFTGTSNGTALTVRGWAFDPSLGAAIGGVRSAGNQFTLPFGTHSEQSVVSDNKLVAGPGAPTVTFVSPNANEHPRLRNHIFERNWVVGSGAPSMTSTSQLFTARNNLFDMSLSAIDYRTIEVQRSEDPTTDDIFFYNNSAFTSVASGADAFAVITVNFSAVRNMVVRNNLGVAPANTNGQTATVRDFPGTSTITQSNNSTSLQIRGASPLTTTPPTQPLHWRPQAATYPINGGTAVPVFSDFFMQPRVGNHLGAVNP